MKTHKWSDLKKSRYSARRLKIIEREVDEEVLAEGLRELRALLGKTQVELAKTLNMEQPLVSRLESRKDHKLSTIRRVVKALGGELEIYVVVGGKRVQLLLAG